MGPLRPHLDGVPDPRPVGIKSHGDRITGQIDNRKDVVTEVLKRLDGPDEASRRNDLPLVGSHANDHPAAVTANGCRERACGDPDLAISYSEIGAHVLRLRDRADERGVQLIWYSPLPLCLLNTVAHGLGNRGCAAADGLLHVGPGGDVLPCSSFGHGESLGNLLRDPFEQVWQSRAARFFRAKQMMPPGCHDCPEAAVCQGACVLYWREVGLAELGGPADGRPPLPF